MMALPGRRLRSNRRKGLPSSRNKPCRAIGPSDDGEWRELPVIRLRQIMDVSPRGYRAWRSRLMSVSQRKDLVVLAHIRDRFEQSLGSYGRPRMTEELKELGLAVGHPLPGRRMRSMLPRGAGLAD